MRKVLIVQPYVPQYRVALFEKLERRLAKHDVSLELLSATPTGAQAERGDGSDALEFQRTVRCHSIAVGSRSVRLKRLGGAPASADLVVAELGSGVLENYPMMWWRKTRFATWGHGYAAASKPNRLDAWLERRQLLRSCHFFAYTESGRRAAIEAGYDNALITVLNNTIDTSALIDPAQEPTSDEVEEFRATHRLGPGPVAAFIGGLDDSKRLDFLLQSGALIRRAWPDFVLVVAGDGAQRSMVEEQAAEADWLRYIGRAGDKEKRLLSATASVLMNPGRVGLVAVDSFALGLPIVTTDWDLHAPEFDYLVSDITALITEDSIGVYSAAVTSLLTDRDQLDAMQHRCRSIAAEYDLESSVARFEAGIMQALGPEG